MLILQKNEYKILVFVLFGKIVHTLYEKHVLFTFKIYYVYRVLSMEILTKVIVLLL